MDQTAAASASTSKPDPGPNLGRRVYVRHGPQVWEAARRLYASGMTAGDVARTLNLSISAIRVAAARGGWTRRHLAASAEGAVPAPAPDEGTLADGPTWFRLSADAWLMIRGEYLGGATAKALAEKWGVSATSIYRHACQEGWTKADRGEAVGAVLIAQTLGELEAASGVPVAAAADPLATAEGLLRRGAGAAAEGLDGPARRSVGMAQELVRCARQLEAARRRSGAVAAAEDEARAAEAQALAAEHPDSPERVAARAIIHRGIERLNLERGRTPPQALSGFFWLEDEPAARPLAEALELVDARGRVDCPDFEAAVESARARGRGALIDRALTELTPWEDCTWLTDTQKALVAAREAAQAVAGPAELPAVMTEDDVADWAALDDPSEGHVEAPLPPSPRRLDDPVWDALRRASPNLSGPLVSIGVYGRWVAPPGSPSGGGWR